MATMLALATQAGAECGKLCDYEWWKTATPADVQAGSDAGADVLARDEEHGTMPLHCAAASGVNQPSAIKELLVLGANANFQDIMCKLWAQKHQRRGWPKCRRRAR